MTRWWPKLGRRWLWRGRAAAAGGGGRDRLAARRTLGGAMRECSSSSKA
jgi:hypothetical protein